MTYSTIPVVFSLFFMLAGCAGGGLNTSDRQVQPPKTQYDAVITDGRGKLLSINQLADRLSDTDIVIIGEFHGHHASHLLQSLLQSALYRHQSQQVLTMEQFEQDSQPALDRYLNGMSGEAEMMEDANAWQNYKASYRPLVEFARAHNLPVIAANAPGDIVRCVGRQGIGHLDTLSAEVRQQLPTLPLAQTPAYREKFFAAMNHGHSGAAQDSNAEAAAIQRVENSYQAQLLRDNTMADRIIAAADAHSHSQIIHLTGTFHSEEQFGTVAALRNKRQELSIAVVSPVIWQAGDTFNKLLADQRTKGDFLYMIQPLPQEFTDSQRQRETMMALFRESAKKTCE